MSEDTNITIDTNITRIESLRNYLMNILNEIDTNYKQLNVNFLSKDPSNYSLDKIPTETEVERWITGLERHRETYSLRSRMEYSVDTIINIYNIGFFETFQDIISEKNEKGELPEIEGIESIVCSNCGTMNNANTNTAEFDIQIQIEYRKEV